MLRRTCLGMIVLALAVQMASAQEREGRGRGGPGGFGFGRRGGPESGTMLLGLREVREELKTTPEQNKQLQELAEELRGRRGDFNPQDFENLSQEERRERFEKMRSEMEARAKESDEKLAKILDAKQIERLNQLRLQRQGAMALGRPEVGKQLGLSEEQQEKIRTIQREAGPGGPGGPGGRNFAEMSDEERREAITKMREQREKSEADVLAVLSDEQKTKWNELQGEKFEFPRGGFGGGPGGRGGPGGGERRRPERKQD